MPAPGYGVHPACRVKPYRADSYRTHPTACGCRALGSMAVDQITTAGKAGVCFECGPRATEGP